MSETHDLLLMVDPVGDQAQPVSQRAFETIRAPKSRVMARNCVALFLKSSGEILHLEAVEPQETGLLATAKLRLGRPLPARYVFETVDISLDDMRVMILDAATYMRERSGVRQWWLMTAPLDEIRLELDKAVTLSELHALIRFPEDQECLELL